MISGGVIHSNEDGQHVGRIVVHLGVDLVEQVFRGLAGNAGVVYLSP